jgi:lipoprotein-anchoring transpeptidase ErfK/SrfK
MISEPFWPQLFSKQGKIDPNNVGENYDAKAKTAIFNNQEIDVPNDLLASENNTSQVLGDNSGDKRIEVDLTKQTLYAYEGDNLVHTFLISSGLWDRTPRGTFKIWIKIRSAKMEGGSKDFGTYYYLPNVPYIMFFYNDQVAKNMGYSLHGTYWHHNFGYPMSHGCINMKTEEVAQLFSWAEVGTPVTIYGKYQY